MESCIFLSSNVLLDLTTERPYVSAGFLTCYPDYAESFDLLLRVLISHSPTYKPQFVELGRTDNYVTVPFDSDHVDELFTKWKVQSEDRPGWIFQTREPFQVSTLITRPISFLNFSQLSLTIEREYFTAPERVSEFLEVLRRFYEILHPAYGDVYLDEMIMSYDHSLGKVKIGTNIERALPDIYWANFLGPEYVEMFGEKKVFSSPCYSVERLLDKGALLLVSPSPLDRLGDPKEFEKSRERLKEYLGKEAFDTGQPGYQGKLPKFRYLSEKRKSRAPSTSKTVAKHSSVVER